MRPFVLVLGLLAVGLPLQARAFQYPGMDFQFVAPVPATKLLSARFVKAAPIEVVAWLDNQDVSVTADAASLARTAPVSVSFSEQPVETAMKLIGKAMGGVFIERSDTWIFRPARISRKPATTRVARGGGRSNAKMVCGPLK